MQILNDLASLRRRWCNTKAKSSLFPSVTEEGFHAADVLEVSGTWRTKKRDWEDVNAVHVR